MAFDSLSGEAHASAKGVLMEDSQFVRHAALDRLRQAFGGAPVTPIHTLSYAGMRKNASASAAAFDTVAPASIGSAQNLYTAWGYTYGPGPDRMTMATRERQNRPLAALSLALTALFWRRGASGSWQAIAVRVLTLRIADHRVAAIISRSLPMQEPNGPSLMAVPWRSDPDFPIHGMMSTRRVLSPSPALPII